MKVPCLASATLSPYSHQTKRCGRSRFFPGINSYERHSTTAKTQSRSSLLALRKLKSRHYFEFNELKPATDAFKRDVSLPVSLKYLRDA